MHSSMGHNWNIDGMPMNAGIDSILLWLLDLVIMDVPQPNSEPPAESWKLRTSSKYQEYSRPTFGIFNSLPESRNYCKQSVGSLDGNEVASDSM